MIRQEDLRHHVTVERIVRTPNETGESIETWQYIANVFAFVRPLRAKERLASDAEVVGDVSHIVTLRWFAGLTSTEHRFKYEGRILDIEGLIDINNAGRFWEATCNERKAA